MSVQPPGQVVLIGRVENGQVGVITLPVGNVYLTSNELIVESTVRDSPAVSFVAPENAKVSFKTPDGLERALFELRLAPGGVDGEFYLGCWSQARYDWAIAHGTASWAAKANDYAMQEVATFGPSGVEFHVPLKASAGMVGAVPAAAEGSRKYSPNGRYCWNYQDDGSFVMYDTHGSTDESTWTARYAVRADGATDAFV